MNGPHRPNPPRQRSHAVHSRAQRGIRWQQAAGEDPGVTLGNADLGPLNPSPALTQKVSQTGPENGPSSQRAPFPIGPRAPRARQTAGVHLFALSNLTPWSKPPTYTYIYMYVASMRMPAHECDHKTAQHGARGAPATAPRAGRVRQPPAAAQAAVSSRFRKTHLLSLRTDFRGEN